MTGLSPPQWRRLTDSPRPSDARRHSAGAVLTGFALSDPVLADTSQATRRTLKGELRAALVEMLLSVLWVFGSLASSVAAHWSCLPR
jgi:hypothetical protein